MSGSRREELECQSCFQKSSSTEKFSCINIDIPRPDTQHAPIHLERCIRETFADELIMNEGEDDGWSCSCGGTSAQKRTNVLTSPFVLLLQLKRFLWTEEGSRKDHAVINVPEIFRLHQQQYRIIAMVNHIGATMDSGHYTAEIHTNNRA